MTRILGIDPGSRTTGFGVVLVAGGFERYIDCGRISAGSGALPNRLKLIHEGIQQLIREHSPHVLAIESVFLNRNADSALKLGQARGAAIAAAAVLNVPVVEYTPATIKQAIVGKGNADKAQVQYMVQVLLKLPGAPSTDAADALACALCHSRLVVCAPIAVSRAGTPP